MDRTTCQRTLGQPLDASVEVPTQGILSTGQREGTAANGWRRKANADAHCYTQRHSEPSFQQEERVRDALNVAGYRECFASNRMPPLGFFKREKDIDFMCTSLLTDGKCRRIDFVIGVPNGFVFLEVDGRLGPSRPWKVSTSGSRLEPRPAASPAASPECVEGAHVLMQSAVQAKAAVQVQPEEVEASEESEVPAKMSPYRARPAHSVPMMIADAEDGDIAVTAPTPTSLEAMAYPVDILPDFEDCAALQGALDEFLTTL